MTEKLKFPRRKGGLNISCDDHRVNYETVKEMITEQPDFYEFKNDDSRKKCIDNDTIWSIQWYPDTPIGFYSVAAPTFEEALAYAMELDEGIQND